MSRILLSHGAGGREMTALIDEVFLARYGDPNRPGDDSATVPLGAHQLAFTTDSYVVDPLFFPGGDIGRLAVAGTVNDLLTAAARPLVLSASFILEEGLKIDTLRVIAESMRDTAAEAGVAIVTGDTKVVNRGKADKLFINTAGIGVLPNGIEVSAHRARSGDKVIVNGFLGDHGAAILQARGDLALDAELRSDCQPLHGLVASMIEAGGDIHCLRDATRGGLAAALNELAETSQVGIEIEEAAVPVLPAVAAACEMLGFDPLTVANEGKLVAICPDAQAETLLSAMRAHPNGRDAAVIGRVVEDPHHFVQMQTSFGGSRIVDWLAGEQLPRIC